MAKKHRIPRRLARTFSQANWLESLAPGLDLNRLSKRVHWGKALILCFSQCFVVGCRVSEKKWLRTHHFRFHLKSTHSSELSSRKDCFRECAGNWAGLPPTNRMLHTNLVPGIPDDPMRPQPRSPMMSPDDDDDDDTIGFHMPSYPQLAY